MPPRNKEAASPRTLKFRRAARLRIFDGCCNLADSAGRLMYSDSAFPTLRSMSSAPRARRPFARAPSNSRTTTVDRVALHEPCRCRSRAAPCIACAVEGRWHRNAQMGLRCESPGRLCTFPIVRSLRAIHFSFVFVFSTPRRRTR